MQEYEWLVGRSIEGLDRGSEWMRRRRGARWWERRQGPGVGREWRGECEGLFFFAGVWQSACCCYKRAIRYSSMRTSRMQAFSAGSRLQARVIVMNRLATGCQV